MRFLSGFHLYSFKIVYWFRVPSQVEELDPVLRVPSQVEELDPVLGIFECTVLDNRRTTLHLFEADLLPGDTSVFDRAVLASGEVLRDAFGVLCWTAAIMCDLPRKLAQEYVSHL